MTLLMLRLRSSTEPVWAAAFLMRQLRDTKFAYPFEENQTPTQYGYKLIGEERFVQEHTYSHHEHARTDAQLFSLHGGQIWKIWHDATEIEVVRL